MHTILSAALRSQLVHQIQKALDAERTASDLSGNLPPQQTMKDSLPPLKQIRQNRSMQIEYVSAIALKDAQQMEQPALQLAKNLMKHISRSIRRESTFEALRNTPTDVTTIDDIEPYFDLVVVPPGWICFRLSAPGLAVWLQSLVEQPLPISKNTSTTLQEPQFLMQATASARDSTNIFPLVHTHARCHSLIRLGQQLGLMQTLQNTQNSSPAEIGEPGNDSFWQIQSPNPFPWLLPDQSFRGSCPSEWQLVEQICATLDDLAQDLAQDDLRQNLRDRLKQADRLSQSWQTFYAECRIADKVRQDNPAQAQVRLGLTWITQKLLHALLRSIGLPTPLFL